METVLCGSTAYRYWRTPPIVLYLAAAPVDSPALRQFLREEELLAFRADLADRLPFLRECTGPSWRNVGQAARDIRDARWLLAPSANFPLDVLAQERGGRRSSGLISTTFWNGGLPFEATCDVTDDLGVTSPAFTMVQMAAQAGFTRTLLLASELCGSYAVYPAPEPIRSLLQRIASRGRLKAFNGWRPCLSGEGNVTDLWQRDPLTTPDDLKAMAEAAEGHRGAAALRKVADAVVPLAASPFETQAGLLLGLPRRLGGEGLDGLSHNEKVELSRDAKLVGQRQCCYCDIYLPDGLDVECQSSQYHDNHDGFLSDAERAAALRLMGVNVLPLTHAQLTNPARFDAFCDAIALARGLERKPRTEKQARAAEQLRTELFIDWAALPDFNSRK